MSDESVFDRGLGDRLQGSTLGENSSQLQDRAMGGEIPGGAGGERPYRPFTGVLEPPQQPVNQATMECHRGPCCHLWRMTTRMEGLYDAETGIRKQAVRQCNAHYEPTNLTDENVYQCSLWWPGWLDFVPQSLRTMLRTKLRAAWEWVLKKRGYDFEWRTWSDDVFEADTAEGRKSGGLKQAKPGLSFQDEFDALLKDAKK